MDKAIATEFKQNAQTLKPLDSRGYHSYEANVKKAVRGWFTGKDGKHHPISSVRSGKYLDPPMKIHRHNDGLTPAAREFISKAISERRHKYPKENPKQSQAIAFSKARKAGYKIPERKN